MSHDINTEVGTRSIQHGHPTRDNTKPSGPVDIVTEVLEVSYLG